MADEDRILTQEEIDALLSRALQKPGLLFDNAAAATAKPSESPKPKETVQSSLPVDGVIGAPAKPSEALKPKIEVQTRPPLAAAAKPLETTKPKAATPPEAPPERTVASYQKYTSSEVKNLQNMLADLAKQVGKLTSALQKIDQLEEKMTQMSAMNKLSPDAVKVLGERIDEVYHRLEKVQPGKSDYNLHDEFQCSHCKSKKLVAVHVKCTNCGHENWMGWWPNSKDK